MSQTQTQTPYAPPESNTSQQSAPATTGASSPRTLVVLAFVFAGVAVFFLPIIFGAAGIICASIAMTKRDPLGKWALAASIAGLAVGTVLSFIVLNSHN